MHANERLDGNEICPRYVSSTPMYNNNNCMYTLPLLITDSYIFPTGQLPGGTIGKSVMDFRIFSGILEKYKVFNLSD